MYRKKSDRQGRWRNKTIAFRVSPEENEQINRLVSLTGLTKQDYLISRCECSDVVVIGNPRVFKALKTQLSYVLDELNRIEEGMKPDEDLLELISWICHILEGMKAEGKKQAMIIEEET